MKDIIILSNLYYVLFTFCIEEVIIIGYFLIIIIAGYFIIFNFYVDHYW